MVHGPLLVFECAAVLDKIAWWNFYLLPDGALQVTDIGTNIDMLDIDTDNQAAPAILPLDFTRPFLGNNVAHPFQRNIIAVGQMNRHFLNILQFRTDSEP